jgi:hypothetical protein
MLRLELTILLTKTERFDSKEIAKDDMDRIRISYPEVYNLYTLRLYVKLTLVPTQVCNDAFNKSLHCSTVPVN